MDMKKKTEIIKSVAVSVTLLFGVWLMSGCKPTEQGYRAAYDAARQKREAAAAEMMIPVSGLLSDDGPQRRIIDGDTLFVTKERVRGADGENLPRWLLAVGVYRMDTNARAQAASYKIVIRIKQTDKIPDSSVKPETVIRQKVFDTFRDTGMVQIKFPDFHIITLR